MTLVRRSPGRVGPSRHCSCVWGTSCHYMCHWLGYSPGGQAQQGGLSLISPFVCPGHSVVLPIQLHQGSCSSAKHLCSSLMIGSLCAVLALALVTARSRASSISPLSLCCKQPQQLMNQVRPQAMLNQPYDHDHAPLACDCLAVKLVVLLVLITGIAYVTSCYAHSEYTPSDSEAIYPSMPQSVTPC